MVMKALQEVKEEAQAAFYKLLPKKSKDNYDQEFRQFEEWRKQRCVIGINEEVMLGYFHNYRRKLGISSLCTKHFLLRSTLKSEARTHKSKKAKILERLHIENIFNQALNSKYFIIKVALIMGISGACRCDGITKLKVDDIQGPTSVRCSFLAPRPLEIDKQSVY